MKQALTALLLSLAMGIQAQNVGIGTSSPNANAKLDITATDKGLLIPRMDSTHRKAIPNTIGLLVYDSTTKSFWSNDGTAWRNMAASASAGSGWSLTGNSGTNALVNFLGTTDNAPLAFRVNNESAGFISRQMVSIGQGAYFNPSPQFLTTVTALGPGALQNNTKGDNFGSGSGNTGIGFNALNKNTTGRNNTALGEYALASNTVSGGNTGLGQNALNQNSTGQNNTATGTFALSNNTTGSENTAYGAGAQYDNPTGRFNTTIGSGAGSSVYNGVTGIDGNTAVGYYSLAGSSDGSYNTALGYYAMLSNANVTNATAIGANARVDASNKVRLGDDNVTVVESNGVFNTVSDGRFKYNIQEDVKGLDFIMQLRPVTYQFDTKKQQDFTKGAISAAELYNHAVPAAFNESNNIKRTGFIAQEVEAAAQKTGFDFDGVKIPATDKQYYSLSYASFVVPLVKAMQQQQQTIQTQQKDLSNQQRDIEDLKKQNQQLLQRLETLENKK